MQTIAELESPIEPLNEGTAPEPELKDPAISTPIEVGLASPDWEQSPDKSEEILHASSVRDIQPTDGASSPTDATGKTKNWSQLIEAEREAVRELGWSQMSWDNGGAHEMCSDP